MKNRPVTINVYEDADYYIVKFSTPLLRDRAKKIAGRKYDADNRQWYWKKTSEVYEALVNEFKNDASRFDILIPDDGEINEVSNPESIIEDADTISLIDEIQAIKEEIIDFKNTDIEQTNTIKILSNQILEQSSLISERIKEKQKPQISQSAVTISDLFAWGLESNQIQLEEDIGFKLNFEDLVGCLNLLHQKLEENLIKLLDIPETKRFGYDLFKLIKEAGDHDVIDKYHINNLHSFRSYRNICGHGIRGRSISQSKQKVAAAVAILSLSLSWKAVVRNR